MNIKKEVKTVNHNYIYINLLFVTYSAFMKSHNQAIKIKQRKIIYMQPIKMILLQIAEISPLQILDMCKPKLDKSRDYI